MVKIENSGIIGFKVKDGRFDGNVFTQFINEILITHFLMHPNDVLVLDIVGFTKEVI